MNLQCAMVTRLARVYMSERPGARRLLSGAVPPTSAAAMPGAAVYEISPRFDLSCHLKSHPEGAAS